MSARMATVEILQRKREAVVLLHGSIVGRGTTQDEAVKSAIGTLEAALNMLRLVAPMERDK